MKNLKLSVFIPFFAVIIFLRSQEIYSQYDSTALSVINKMSGTISDMQSCSFKLQTNYDVFDYDLGNIKHSENAEVYMKGSNKFKVEKRGDKGHKEILYDGWNLVFYSFHNNQYAVQPAPATSMETIEEFSLKYGIEFPGADVFYPNLSQDITSSSQKLSNLGKTKVTNIECYHLAWKTDKMTIQLWIADDANSLPVKLSIVYNDEQGSPQYEAIFSDWNINPELADSMFDFTVPPKAMKVKFSPSK
ncbi:MAG TPA: DUF2092 domain-containing protein [Ignavibacteria bacterium]|nr:DUF2092 domain-containing protein [Ignavibacteria bacterium]